MIKSVLKKFLDFKIPPAIKANFKKPKDGDLKRLEKILRNVYFRGDDHYLSTNEGKEDLIDHLYRRLEQFRQYIIPWINSVVALKEANILEIGCGTGSSTVALAEQGAKVTGIDIIAKDVEVAKERCSLYGVSAEFVNCNATEVYNLFRDRRFDLIIFFAALEHMTIEERITSLRNTWVMLGAGSFLSVIGTPNRLWYFDDHTSNLPFFHWLPDELAFYYTKYSPKKTVAGKYTALNPELMLHFLRRGRGVSYHEFEIAIDNVTRLNVAGCLSLFIREKSLARRIVWSLKKESKYERFLYTVAPNIPRAFFQPYLDLIIKK